METIPVLLALCAGNSPVPVKSPHKGQRCRDVSLICAWINDWVNNREAGDLRHHRGHYDVTVMLTKLGRQVGPPAPWKPQASTWWSQQRKGSLMTCNLASYLDTAPQTTYPLHVSHKKSSMPSTTHCTPRLHTAFVDLEKSFDCIPRLPEVPSGGLFTCLALRRGWWGSYKARMEMSEAECVLFATWVKSSAWKWALVWAPCCSSQFRKPYSKNFGQDASGKTCMQMTWPSSLIRWRNCKRSWSSEDQHGSKVTSGQNGQNQGL